MDGSGATEEIEKIDKYQDLGVVLGKLWGLKVEVVPIVIGALGVVSNRLSHWLDILKANT